MRLPYKAVIAVAIFSLLAQPAAGLWESWHGSTERSRHCDPIEEPQWSPPGLLFFEPSYAESLTTSGLSVITAEAMGWTHTNRSLMSLERRGIMKHHDQDFEQRWSQDIGYHYFYTDLVDLDQDGVQELMVPWQQARYDLRGRKIATYTPLPLLPGMGSADTGRAVPAVGDFTGDGAMELIFTGEWEWQAFRADGEMIARYTVIDERDQGQDTKTAHMHDGRYYAFLVTGNAPYVNADNPPDELVPMYTRLQKVTLVPTGLGLPSPNLTQSGIAGLGDPRMPFQFEILWSRDFPAAVTDEALLFHDFTGDGGDEIVISHMPWHDESANALTILDADGNILYTHPWNALARTGIGDVNGDGIDELVATLGFNRHEYHTGNPYERYWEPGLWISGIQWNGLAFEEIYHFQADAHYGGAGLVLCDMDGNGKDEILVRLGEPTTTTGVEGVYAGEGKVVLLNHAGDMLWEYRHFYGQPWRILIDDFTGDGRYEIIVGNYMGQVFVFSSAIEPSVDDYERVFTAQLEFGWITEEEADWMRASLGPRGDSEPEEIVGAPGLPVAWAFASVVVLCLAALHSATRKRRREST